MSFRIPAWRALRLAASTSSSRRLFHFNGLPNPIPPAASIPVPFITEVTVSAAPARVTVSETQDLTVIIGRWLAHMYALVNSNPKATDELTRDYDHS